MSVELNITYVRVGEGTTHPVGIYLNSEQLAHGLETEGLQEAADYVRRVERVASETHDDVLLGPRVPA